jgi:hypothetical protein
VDEEEAYRRMIRRFLKTGRIIARARDTQLTPEERKAGWTEADLERYQAERDRAAAQSAVGAFHLVGGFVVTAFKRARPSTPVLEGPRMGSKHYSPHQRWMRSTAR